VFGDEPNKRVFKPPPPKGEVDIGFFIGVEKVAPAGCSKSSRCKAGKIPRHEAYFPYVE
jgi:hypothetical protein